MCLLVSADEAVLRDLKHLLLEAKQKVPEFLLQVESDWDFISRGGEGWGECDGVEVWWEVGGAVVCDVGRVNC